MECGLLITETGDLLILTESGDQLVTECFALSRPGRISRTVYPYWSPRKKSRKDEDEELMILAAIESD